MAQLIDHFSGSSHVQFHGLSETDDSEIWKFAKLQGFCIVTQDADFAERSRLYGSPPKVIWLRCGNTPTSHVEAMLRNGTETIQQFLSNSALDYLELY